jgi:uncharacterized membrane protein
MFNKRLISVIALVASASVAQAELIICNSSTNILDVSIGYNDGNKFTSEGWWTVFPNGCQPVVQGDLTGRDYYLHASARPNGVSYQGTGNFFCTLPNEYIIVGDSNCASRGFQSEEFYEIDTGTHKLFTHTFN